MKLIINEKGKTFDTLPIEQAFKKIDVWKSGVIFSNNPIIIKYIFDNKKVSIYFNNENVTNSMNVVFSFYAEILNKITYETNR